MEGARALAHSSRDECNRHFEVLPLLLSAQAVSANEEIGYISLNQYDPPESYRIRQSVNEIGNSNRFRNGRFRQEKNPGAVSPTNAITTRFSLFNQARAPQGA